MLVEINENNIDKRLIKQAVDILKSGGILILPTDTVYAMGCVICTIKRRLTNWLR